MACTIVANLKIVADDLGLAKPINDGIFELLKTGRISGASLMANGEAFDDAVNRCLEVQLPNIGVHFVLVEEKSITGIELPKNHKSFFLKYILGIISKKDIESELKAQVNKIISAGVRPVFINSHQHLHLLPGIMDMVIEIAKENNITYIRLVDEPMHGNGKIFRKIQLVFLRFLSSLARKKLNKAGLVYNNKFIGFINAGDLGMKDIEIAKQIKDGIIDMGCHPGYEDEELRKKYGWGNAYNWQKELKMLKYGDENMV